MNSKTTRCALFQEIASEIWYEIIYHHQVGVNVPEIGITNRIIAKLLHNKNCGVWANPGYKEDEFGSDLDIFVETTTGSFVWYALQAKVLKKDGCYHGVK
ncbi:MAG: hypothetical protein LBN93_04245, partial [Candidatus Symbiothrix sp.]|nr:hypothetical protein [Candidatus Symbiothrix sp.]